MTAAGKKQLDPGWRKLTREPLFLFAMIGALLFALYLWLEHRGQEPVRYDATVEAALVEEFELLAGRKATPADRASLREDFLTEELLFREALSQEMYLTDSGTRERLVDKMRYMIVGAPAEPSNEELLNYYSENMDRYRSEDAISFDHVFFKEKPAGSAEILAALERGEVIAGDEFWMGKSFADYGHSMIRGMFGQDFLQDLQKLPNGSWIGPVKTARGWHFVRKAGSREAELMPFQLVREQVRQDYVTSRASEAIAGAVLKLKEKHVVEIDG